MIDPRVASGTRDILPALALERERITARLKQTFERYGFVPIDTPVLERREVLYAKGGQEVQRQVFEVAARGGSLEDSDLALRFDLTVPLARFMARHVEEIGVPFKRYHIGLVYRGERAQRGRYREFYQCDFDTIGTRSALSDAEIGLVIHDGLRAAGILEFTLRLNNRLILAAMLDSLGLAQHSEHVLRSLDKLGKIGREAVLEELQYGEAARERARKRGGAAAARSKSEGRILTLEDARRIVDFVQSSAGESFEDMLNQRENQLGSGTLAREGLDNLRGVCELLVAGGVPQEQILVDVGMSRGLDYYTGIVFETTVTGYEDYGSVCSGGRYDDLASLFTARRLPGVGASFGLDRLTQLMADAGRLEQPSTVASVLIVNFQQSDRAQYVRMARELRSAGIASEIYPDPEPVREQFGYASKRGHRLALVAGPDELAADCFALRDMAARQQQSGLPLEELVARVAAVLNRTTSPTS